MRIRINFRSDFCNQESCDICFRDVSSVAVQRNTVSETRSKNRNRERFLNVPKFINNFYHESAQLAKKIEESAKKENVEVEVKITTTVKNVVAVDETDEYVKAAQEALARKVALIKSLTQKAVSQTVIAPKQMEISFDMLMGRKANIEDSQTQYTKDDTIIDVIAVKKELEVKR